MRYAKKFKYKLKKYKISASDNNKDLPAEELYENRLRSKKRIARKR